TPAPVVRIVQSWKEGILLLLSLMAAAAFIRAWRAGHLPRPNLFDLLVAVFAGVAVIYTVLPPSLLHGSANLQQRVIGLRVLLLRMVSTYVSPLGIAYAGLVVVPLAVALILALKQARKRWLAAASTILLLAGILFSLTRLALLMTVAEFLMLAVLTRRRWVLYATPVVAA